MSARDVFTRFRSVERREHSLYTRFHSLYTTYQSTRKESNDGSIEKYSSKLSSLRKLMHVHERADPRFLPSESTPTICALTARTNYLIY